LNFNRFFSGLILLFFLTGNGSATVNPPLPEKAEFVKAKVLSIRASAETPRVKIQDVSFLVMTGSFKGLKVEAKNYLWDDDSYNTILRTGKSYVLKITSKDGRVCSVRIAGYYRQNFIILLLAVFLTVLFLVTGLRTLRIFLSMAINAAGFLFILIPLLKAGVNPVAATFLFCFLSLIITLVLITGFNVKSAASFAGTASSVVLAAFLAALFQRSAHITGLYSEGARMLLTLGRAGSAFKINFFQLGISAVLLAALGMAIDVSVSISSFITELHEKRKALSAKSLFKSGISVGSDILATMVNSLVFIFMGLSLPLILNCRISGIPQVLFLNFEFVAARIIQTLLASSVLILTVPLTALSAAFLVKRK